MTENKVAVNVFNESENDPVPRVDPETPQTSQQPADRPGAEAKQQENTSTTQVIAQDDTAAAVNTLSISLPWIAAAIVAMVILAALFTILRKLNKRQ